LELTRKSGPAHLRRAAQNMRLDLRRYVVDTVRVVE